MIHKIKSLFKIPTALEVAANDLAFAELEALAAESNLEYWGSQVPMLEARCVRLREFLRGDK